MDSGYEYRGRSLRWWFLAFLFVGIPIGIGTVWALYVTVDVLVAARSGF